MTKPKWLRLSHTSSIFNPQISLDCSPPGICLSRLQAVWLPHKTHLMSVPWAFKTSLKFVRLANRLPHLKKPNPNSVLITKTILICYLANLGYLYFSEKFLGRVPWAQLTSSYFWHLRLFGRLKRYLWASISPSKLQTTQCWPPSEEEDPGSCVSRRLKSCAESSYHSRGCWGGKSFANFKCRNHLNKKGILSLSNTTHS